MTFVNHRAAKAALAALGLGLAVSAQAATPESGTLTLDSGPIEFSGGPNVGWNVTPQVGATCMDPLLPCDHFALTVDLPDNLVEYFPAALVKMIFTWDDPAGAGAEDYDIYLYDAAGNEANSAATGSMPEVMTQLANGGVEEFQIDIVYFLTLGSTYTGKVELDLGEPAEGVDTDEFFMQNSVLGHALQNPATQELNETVNGEEADSRSDSYVERRSASGSFGGAMLLLGLLGLARRRRG